MPIKGFKGTLTYFAENTSIAGIPHINRSKRYITKLYWLLFFGACMFMIIFQMSHLVVKYMSRPYSTKVNLQHSAVDFPTVTICNVNPVRRSKYHLSPELSHFINHLNFDNAIKTEYLVRAGETFNETMTPSVGLPHPGNSSEEEGQNKSAVNDPYGDFHQYDYFDYDGEDTEFKKVQDKMKDILGTMSRELLSELGHQKKDAILHCSFNGRDCSHLNFTSFAENDYGNCWAFNSIDMIEEPKRAYESGAAHGLKVVLFKQDDEYIGTTQGGGFRVSIMEYGTFALPAHMGMYIPTGFNTDVALRMVNISRLGHPYSECGRDDDYERMFHRKYTEEMCYHSCTDRLIAKRCHCHRTGFIDYYSFWDKYNTPPCDKDFETLQCQRETVGKARKKELFCECPQACHEITFEKTTSMYNWPDIEYRIDLVNRLCEVSNMSAECLYMVKIVAKDTEVKTDYQMKTNFASMNIYFSELNYQVVEQEPSYELAQFASDIGGTLGLWMGISVFALSELLWLGVLLIRIICNHASSRQQTEPSTEADGTTDRENHFDAIYTKV